MEQRNPLLVLCCFASYLLVLLMLRMWVVSATANPIANSSGSVTNQAIQVLQGPYITNQYGGGGIAVKGPTANITPFITHARNEKDPF